MGRENGKKYKSWAMDNSEDMKIRKKRMLYNFLGIAIILIILILHLLAE